MVLPVVPKHFTYPIKGEAADAVELVQSSDVLTAMMTTTVGWGDLAWAEDWVSAQRARAERHCRGELTPPPSPVHAPHHHDEAGWNRVGASTAASSSSFRVWDRNEEDDDTASVCSTASWDSAYDPRLCTAEEYDWYVGQRKLAKVHRDENGEPEECRFFNSVAGCREAEKCPYKHIKKSLSDIPCRFFRMSIGCRKGKTCPYKHC